MVKYLEENGFRYIRSNGSHRIYRHPVSNFQTSVPMHCKDLKPGTEHNILKQAGLL